MKKLRANVCAVTHAGRIRKENEDNYDLNGRMTSTGDLKKGSAFVQSMTEPFHLSVCDGMGGESYGELASGIAVETIAAHAANVYESGEDFSFAISNCLDDANSRICAEINARGKRMGTTLATIYAVKGNVICVNIGDTRVYHYSKGILEQISFDHTHAQTIVDAGEVSIDNIGRIPDAKRLTRHLGVFPEEGGISPNISVIDDVDDGDIILLCSDGLTDMLSDDEITAILSTGESAQSVASKLVRKALEYGGKDNITVMAAFMNVEETAIFVPIATAMVGDKDADYEEEYRNSFGSNVQSDDDDGIVVSPYANADARAYSKPVDKAKIMKIVGAVIAVVILVLFGALAFKALLGNKEPSDESLSSTTYAYPVAATTYPVYSPPVYTTRPLTTWSFELPSESETEESTTEEITSTTRKRVTTTRKKTTTTRKANTTKKTTTTKKSTTAARVTTTRAKTTTEKETTTAVATTIEPTTERTTVPTATTSSAATSTTSAANDSTTSSATTNPTTSTTRASSSTGTTVGFSNGYIIFG